MARQIIAQKWQLPDEDIVNKLNRMSREKIVHTLNMNRKAFLKQYHLPYEEQ